MRHDYDRWGLYLLVAVIIDASRKVQPSVTSHSLLCTRHVNRKRNNVLRHERCLSKADEWRATTSVSRMAGSNEDETCTRCYILRQIKSRLDASKWTENAQRRFPEVCHTAKMSTQDSIGVSARLRTATGACCSRDARRIFSCQQNPEAIRFNTAADFVTSSAPLKQQR